MPSEKPVILMSDAVLKQVAVMMSGDYDVEKLWEYDRAQFLKDRGPAVRAVVHAGEMALPNDLLAGMPNLGLIACVSVGYDGIDIPWCRARGIEVTHARWLNAEDVADHAVGLMISAYRGIVEGDRYLRDGSWQAGEPRKTRGSLTGKTIGIIGLGNIGSGVARRAEAMGMNIAWWGPRPKPAAWLRADDVLALAEASDVLVVASRADETNRNLIDRRVMEALGRRGLLVNVARGQIVDEDALIAALREGVLGMAALDVFWSEPTPAARWVDVPNVVLTPHLAGATAESVVKLVGQAADNLRRFFAGEPLASPVELDNRP